MKGAGRGHYYMRSNVRVDRGGEKYWKNLKAED